MTAIITVVGQDMVGITAEIANTLAETSVNILNISQITMDEYFTMMMKVDLSGMTVLRSALLEKLDDAGKRKRVQVNLIHEDVLRAMHRI